MRLDLMFKTPTIRLTLVAAALGAVPATVFGQIRASEIGSMSQIIDGTKITMEYSRPRARGRNPLFGGRVVRWDEVWTPGANWATTLETTKDITLDGQKVPKGKYSVWMVVRQDGNWTTILDPRAHRYHEERPDSIAGQIRIATRPREAPFTEVLTWSMPALTGSGGTLTMQWGTTLVSMDVGVEPSLKMTMSAEEAAPFIGAYGYTERMGPDSGKTKTLFVTHENNTLKGRWEPNDPYFKTFALVSIAPGWFAPGVYDERGQIYEVYKPEMTFEFTTVNGKAVSLVVRGEDDTIEAEGKRKP
jgi:hypothetical protein